MVKPNSLTLSGIYLRYLVVIVSENLTAPVSTFIALTVILYVSSSKLILPIITVFAPRTFPISTAAL